MSRLVAWEAVLPFVERVDLEERAPARAERGAVFAVFTGQAARFVGLVTASAVERGPGRTFAELLRLEPQIGVLHGILAEKALHALRSGGGAAVAVLDDQGDFVGALTRDSLMDALLRKERLRDAAMYSEHVILNERLRAATAVAATTALAIHHQITSLVATTESFALRIEQCSAPPAELEEAAALVTGMCAGLAAIADLGRELFPRRR